MLLPPALFAEFAPHFEHHNAWHVSRFPGQEALRAHIPGECGSVLAGLDEAGSGCDFLKFHRCMMRHFFYVLRTVPCPTFRFDPWPDDRLPVWVERALLTTYPGFKLEAAYRCIDSFVADGEIESLGGFIEANDHWRPEPGASLHNRLHMALSHHECATYCGDHTSPMNDLGRSPGNVLFWTLHDWVDRRYEQCQRNAHEVPDRSPTAMHLHGHVFTQTRAWLPV